MRDEISVTATRRRDVTLLIAAGVIVAFEVGKVPIALPALRAEFAIGPVTASWLLSTLSLVGGIAGIVFGALADRIGQRRLVLGGLVVIAAASGAGAFSPGVGALLAGRFVEGLGLVAVTVSAPALIAAYTVDTDRRLALGLWSAYIPAGTAIVMLVAPFALARGGWPALWLATAAVTLAIAVVLAATLPRRARGSPDAPLSVQQDIIAVATARDPLALAVAFGGYAACYLGMVGFLPSLIVAAGNGVAVAATVSAVIVLVNGAGNVAGGFLAAHVPRRTILAVGAAIMGCGGALLYVHALPLNVRIAAVACGALAGGTIPAAIMASVPAYTPSPRLMATTQGLIVQGSAVGQLGGPVVVAALGGLHGSLTAAIAMLAYAALPFGAALVLRR